MSDEHIAEIRKTDRETIRITLGEFRNRPIADVRVWYTNRDGSLSASRSGVAFRIELLEEVSDGLQAAVKQAHARGLLPPEQEP